MYITEKFGNDSEKDTPVPIPNTAVKFLSANGTWGAAPWESRTLPIKRVNLRILRFIFFMQKYEFLYF